VLSWLASLRFQTERHGHVTWWCDLGPVDREARVVMELELPPHAHEGPASVRTLNLRIVSVSGPKDLIGATPISRLQWLRKCCHEQS
jgi:hypothetical protein